jgi:dipeptidase
MKKGIWGEAGINEANVAMSATETITSNPRVLGCDPLVPNGIGEEDYLTIVLPYIKSAREGVIRTGELLEQYGTYEFNGVAFSDEEEIWWIESVGGHHWIAKRVPDDSYVVVANQLGIDELDLTDTENVMASADLATWLKENHLQLNDGEVINARLAFGSHTDNDHHYNTPRQWFIQRKLNPEIIQDPMSDNIPWARVPARKITIEDVKEVLSGHYQDTEYDPYGAMGTDATRRAFRPIGINRTAFLGILQIRPYMPESFRALQWMAFSAMPFNTMVPMYANVNDTPTQMKNTTDDITTENFYWLNRLLAVICDPHYNQTAEDVDQYVLDTMSLGHQMIHACDEAVSEKSENEIPSFLEEVNQNIMDKMMKESKDLLAKVLYTASMNMTNHFSRGD